MMENLDLPVVWAALLALAVFLYVLLDGFDLGVGILFPFADTDAHRDQMMDAVVLLMMAVVSLWLPLSGIPAAARWGLDQVPFDWDRLLPLAPIPLLVIACFTALVRALRNHATHAPYGWSVGLFVLAYAGLLVGLWPYLVPYGLTIHAAAASPDSQAFLLAGTLFLLPLILGYTIFVYWTFRGKVGRGSGYH